MLIRYSSRYSLNADQILIQILTECWWNTHWMLIRYSSRYSLNADEILSQILTECWWDTQPDTHWMLIRYSSRYSLNAYDILTECWWDTQPDTHWMLMIYSLNADQILSQILTECWSDTQPDTHWMLMRYSLNADEILIHRTDWSDVDIIIVGLSKVNLLSLQSWTDYKKNKTSIQNKTGLTDLLHTTMSLHNCHAFRKKPENISNIYWKANEPVQYELHKKPRHFSSPVDTRPNWQFDIIDLEAMRASSLPA